MGRTMTWRNEGRLNVVVHGAKRPCPFEWSRYLSDMSRRKDDELRVVVLSYGGAPDGAQRLALSSMVEGGNFRVPLALLTDTLLVRAMIGTLRLFNPAIRAFGLSQTGAAYDFLGLTPEERERVTAIRGELEAELDEPTEHDAAHPRSSDARR